MTCREADALVGDYLDELLPPLTRGRVARHLGACAPCRRNILTYADTIDLVRTAFDEPPPMGETETRALVSALAVAVAH